MKRRSIELAALAAALFLSGASFESRGLLPARVGAFAIAEQAAASPQAEGPGQAHPETFFAGLQWRQIGPNRGGRSIAVAGSASRPFEYYFGATGGGLWKTTDGGTTWTAVTDKGLRTSSVGAVAIAPSNPDIVFAGMGEVALRGNVIQGDGVYKSIDAGKTWHHAGLADTQAIGRIRIDPSNPGIVYVAALGHIYGPNEERGVFKSDDGGKTWRRVLFKSPRAGAVDLALDPGNPRVLYAAIWEVFRTPHSLSSGGPDSGLYKSTDAGESWTEITRNAGLPKGTVGKIGVAVSGADSNRVYAIVEAADGGIFRSDDGGATWTKVNDERRFRQRAFYYTRIYADPRDRDTMYVLNTGFYRSTDGGRTYQTIRVPHGDNHDLWIAPDDPKRMINANDGGANVSVNGGETWTDQDYPTAQVYHVVTTSHVPYHVCGAQQDNSTVCVPSTGSGGEFYQVGGGESGYIAPDPSNTNVFYAGSYGGLLTRYDRTTGQLRQVNVWPENPMGHSSIDIRERFQWTFPIVFSPHDPKVLYVGSQHVWRTTDEGQTWRKISPDLTRAAPETMGPSGGPITLDQTGVETYATVFTIAPSPVDRSVIWAGSDDGIVSVTKDSGASWQRVTPPGLPEFSRVSLIEASPHAPGTAFVAANRYQRDDRSPYLYRTDDYGGSWKDISRGLPPGDFTRAVREDPKRKDLLVAGTEHGVHVSFDGGSSWQSLRLNLPVTPVHDMAFKDDDLVIATHGRSFYVMDNISVLRQLKPEVRDEAVHLFRPADGVRAVSRGVAIDYYLREPAAQVTIDILDAYGNLVRSFTGGASEEAKKETRPAGDDEPPRQQAEPRPGGKAGMNRFTWDMRHRGPTGFPGMILWAASLRGPAALPGSYQVKLTADGQTRTEMFRILRHPNIANVTDDDLRARFQMASAITAKVSQANEAVVRIRGLKGQIEERLARAGDKKADAKLLGAGKQLIDKLTRIEGEIYQYRNQSSQDPLNYPIKLNNKLAALMGVVESAEAPPTESAREVFRELSGRLDLELTRLEGVERNDLTAFNKLLAGRKLEAVKKD
ncbi:MAG: glycosyl hydrolase [Vicinamibacterales bacterium]